MSRFCDVLKRYGQEVTVFTGGCEHSVRAIVNPVISERYIKRWKIMTDLGEVDNSSFYYFGPPDLNIDDCEGSYVECGGRRYSFIRAEKYTVEGVTSHWEGMLRPWEEDFDD